MPLADKVVELVKPHGMPGLALLMLGGFLWNANAEHSAERKLWLEQTADNHRQQSIDRKETNEVLRDLATVISRSDSRRPEPGK